MMLFNIIPRMVFDIPRIMELDRAFALAVCYGMGWRKAQEVLDPDLHTPSLSFIAEDLEC